MNAEAKKKWVEALRSGKYEQVKGQLYAGSNGTVKCCAMGVLNDISGLGYWDEDNMYCVDSYADDELNYFSEDHWWELIFDNLEEFPELAVWVDGYGEYAEVRCPTSPPSDGKALELYKRCVSGEEEFAHLAVIEWAGLEYKDPTFKIDGEEVEMHELNDGRDSVGSSVGNHPGWMTFEQIAEIIEAQL